MLTKETLKSFSLDSLFELMVSKLEELEQMQEVATNIGLRVQSGKSWN
jgi:hypothetical protein